MKCYACKKRRGYMIKTINILTQKADWICNDCLSETDEQYERFEKRLKGR